MRGFSTLLAIIELVLRLYAEHRQKRRDQRVEDIRSNPSGAWAGRFGRLQPTADHYDDAEQLPADSANTARPEPGRPDSNTTS